MRLLHFISSLLLTSVGTALLFLFIYMRALGSVAVIEESIWIWGIEVGFLIVCVVVGVVSATNIALNKLS